MRDATGLSFRGRELNRLNKQGATHALQAEALSFALTAAQAYIVATAASYLQDMSISKEEYAALQSKLIATIGLYVLNEVLKSMGAAGRERQQETAERLRELDQNDIAILAPTFRERHSYIMAIDKAKEAFYEKLGLNRTQCSIS